MKTRVTTLLLLPAIASCISLVPHDAAPRASVSGAAPLVAPAPAPTPALAGEEVAVEPLAGEALITYVPQDAEPTADEHRINTVSVLLGQRSLDDDWEPNEDQFLVGAEYAIEPPDLPVGFELGFYYSDDEGNINIAPFGRLDTEVETWEISAGVRKSLHIEDSPLLPYIGAGVSWIDLEGKVEGISDDDSSIGAYVHAGLVWQIQQFRVGVDLRFLFGTDIDIAGVDNLDADYVQGAVVLGWSF